MNAYWQQMFDQQILWLFLLIILQLASKKIIKFFPDQPLAWKQLLLTILTGAGLGTMMLALAPFFPTQRAVLELKNTSNLFWPVLVLLGTGPLLEEIIFRGLLGAILLRFMPFWPAAVLNGFIFALGHGSGWLLVPFTLAGGVLFWLFCQQRAIFFPWLAHVIWNSLVFWAQWQ